MATCANLHTHERQAFLWTTRCHGVVILRASAKPVEWYIRISGFNQHTYRVFLIQFSNLRNSDGSRYRSRYHFSFDYRKDCERCDKSKGMKIVRSNAVHERVRNVWSVKMNRVYIRRRHIPSLISSGWYAALSRSCRHDRRLKVTREGYVFFFPWFLRFRFIGAFPIPAVYVRALGLLSRLLVLFLSR